MFLGLSAESKSRDWSYSSRHNLSWCPTHSRDLSPRGSDPLCVCANSALLPVGLSLDLSEPGQREAEGLGEWGLDLEVSGIFPHPSSQAATDLGFAGRGEIR